MLGINLTDADVTNVPLFVMDEYGEFIRGRTASRSSSSASAPTAISARRTTSFVEGNLAATRSATAGAVRTGHAFLDDIAQCRRAGRRSDGDPATPDGDTASRIPSNADGSTADRRRGRKLLTTTNCSTRTTSPATGAATRISASRPSTTSSIPSTTTPSSRVRPTIESGDLAFLNEWL